MADFSICAESVAKSFKLGTEPDAFRTMRDVVSSLPTRLRGRRQREVFWALEDVSFELRPGEAIGLIGANGAGKSTLLKILSRITEPTRGRALIRGRVGSLLEVGAGFHPELTGRENIQLSAAIVGMRKAEIARKLDGIAAFAEIERFLDTPVKRYSTGMYLRLGFSIAAHVEADILLVDEVLAVGDLAFQRKCLGRLRAQTSADGCTVIFVSHNLTAVKALTDRCLWLDRGRLRGFGATDDIFREYLLAQGGAGEGHRSLAALHDRVLRPAALALDLAFETATVRAPDGSATDVHLEGQPITVEVGVRCLLPRFARPFEISCRVRTLDNVTAFVAFGGLHEEELFEGVYRTAFTIDPNPLAPGTYELGLALTSAQPQDEVPIALRFHVEANPAPNTPVRNEALGVISVDYPWQSLEPALGDAVAR